MSWYMNALKNYVNFSGRAMRREYWIFTLVNIIIFIGIGVLANKADEAEDLFVALSFVFALAIAMPSISVTVRRLHDIDKSGWWILITYVPFIGGLWLLILTCQSGNPGLNSYGPDPRGTVM